MTNADANQDPHRPLEPGQEWHIGGQDRQMDDQEQLEQLVAYIDAHYDTPDFRPPWAGAALLRRINIVRSCRTGLHTRQ